MRKLSIPNNIGLFWRAIKALNSRDRVFAFFLIGVLIFSLAGLGLDLSRYWRGAGTNEEESGKVGGTYNIGLVGAIKYLNPLFADFSNVDRSVTGLVYSGLTKYDPLSGEFVADLATYELSADKRKYVFTLKEGIKWHDGENLTVDDIVFTYGLIQSEGFANAVLRSNFAGVSVNKENATQISFTLGDPNAFFITNTSVGILPRHVYQDVAVAELAKTNANPIGSGPYRLSGPIEGGPEESVITLERFPDYFNETPKFAKVKFKIFPHFELLLKNVSHLHAIEKLSEEDLALLPDRERFDFYPFSLPQYMAVFFNFDSPLMKSKNLRIAAMKAVDREQILAQISGKIPVDNPLLDLDQSEWFFKHNPTEAMGALFSLGWKLPETSGQESATESPSTPKTRVNSKGEKLVLRLIAQELPTGGKSQIEQMRLIELLKKNWAAVGIEARDEYYILPELQERIKARDYDLLLFGINMGYNLDIYANWHSSQGGEKGLNFSNYKSFEADALIENIRQTFTAGPETESKLKKLRSVIADDFPAVFLYAPKYYLAVDKRIKGVDIRNLAFPADQFAYFAKWYIKE